jgi:hypothetical protein
MYFSNASGACCPGEDAAPRVSRGFRDGIAANHDLPMQSREREVRADEECPFRCPSRPDRKREAWKIHALVRRSNRNLSAERFDHRVCNAIRTLGRMSRYTIA